MAYPIDDIAQRIVYNREGLVVVNKPFDIPTSGKHLDDPDALQFWVEKYLGRRVWAVHQLDADTTGVNLFVTSKSLVKKYQQALSDSSTTKRYLAVVHGKPLWNTYHCTSPIGKIDKRSLGVISVEQGGAEAESFFRVLGSSGLYSLLEAKITTGRTHQIRIHLTYLGFPLVGDDWYGVQEPRIHIRQALHAESITFGDKALPHLTVPLAEDLVELCRDLGL